MRPIGTILRSRASWPVRTFTVAMAMMLLPATALIGLTSTASAGTAWGTVTLPANVPDGQTHFAMDGNGNVYTLLPGGGVNRYTIANNTSTPLDTGQSFGGDYFAVDHSGNVYINTGSGTIVKIDALGNQSNFATALPIASGPVTVDTNGNLWVASWTNSSTDIYKFTSGVMSSVGTFTGFHANAMMVAPNGTLYAVNYSANLDSMSPAGVVNVVDNTLRGSEGVAVDGAGNVFVASEFDGTVFEYPATGGQRQSLGDYITSGAPETLTIDGSSLYAYSENSLGSQVNILGTYPVVPLTYNYVNALPVPQLNVASALVTQTSSFSQSITASWHGVAGATSYTCTLMYGYGIPSTFKVSTTSASCSFGNLSLNSQYGVQVVAIYGGVSSSPMTMFAPAVQIPKTSIVCARGHARKRVTAVNPRCPLGYHKV